ncbi:MAG: autotransporter-associated beta strand repeat-containing protein, partial [Brevundimonas sp.]
MSDAILHAGQRAGAFASPRRPSKSRRSLLATSALTAVTALILAAPGTARAQAVIDGGATVIVPDTQPSPWNIVGDLYVGQSGSGTLIITDGGVVTTDTTYIALTESGIGSATVTGAGSIWATDRLWVGNLGSGTLEVVEGGEVTTTSSTIGGFAGSSGSATVSGAGSLWTNNWWFRVGQGGSGDLLVANGGQFTSAIGFIGEGSSGSGSVTVTGAGSLWANSSEVYVGTYGAGALSIADGGVVRVGGGTGWIQVGRYAGSTGVVTIGAATGDAAVAAGTFEAGELRFGAGSGSLVFNHTGTAYNFHAAITGAGAVNHYAGTTVLTADNTYSGATTISGGTLVVEGQSDHGAGAMMIAPAMGTSGNLIVRSGGTLDTGAAVLGSFGMFGMNSSGNATVAGAGSAWVADSLDIVSGSLTLTDGGTVQVGDGSTGVLVGRFSSMPLPSSSIGAVNIGAADGSAAASAGTLDAGTLTLAGSGSGRLVFNHTETDYDFDTAVGGSGALLQRAGGTTLTADSSAFAGSTTVSGGLLRVDGALGGAITVTGGLLGGAGLVGAVNVTTGGLVGQAGSVLTFGSLTLGADAEINVLLDAPSADALFDVTGDLTLDGTLHIDGLTGFGQGVYGLFTYGGALTDNGLAFGDLPAGHLAADMAIQTSQAGQVNLVNGAELLFWDGGDPLNADNGVVDGGDGTWTLTGDTWTDAAGAETGAMMPVPGFGVFMGEAGAVTLDDSAGGLSVTGLQFAADGYVLTGDDLALVEATPGSGTDLRVGDGTATGADWIATIGANLTSTNHVRKTDHGTLVLTGVNSFGGYTQMRGGELVVTGALTSNGDVHVATEAGDVATLTISDGGGVTGAWGALGLNAGAAGVATVTGADSRWINSGQLVVGMYGEGDLTIADGGAVTNTMGSIGYGGGSTGSATVTGAGSTWSNTGALTVGDEGDGHLTIADGGVVTSDYARVGDDGGAGTVLVTGAGSQWTYASYLQMYDGSIVIADDGLISGSDAILEGGAVQVTGQGSLWQVDSSFMVGSSQNADLVLTDGGTVSADELSIGRYKGGDGRLFIGSDDLSAPAAAGFVDVDVVTIDTAGSALIFNHTETDYVFAAAITGRGGSISHHAGVTTLSADSSGFDGVTEVLGGTLLVDGVLDVVGVFDGGALGGSGRVGAVVVEDGGALLGRSGQTLTLEALSLASGSIVEVALGAASSDALFDVTGDLILDGALTVTDVGGFGAGVYRLFDYGGALTDNGLEIGATPTGVTADDLLVQTAVAGQVSLVSAAGQDLLFWDGGAGALHNNGAVDGGAGTWTPGGQTWTGANGLITSALRPDPAFAVFMGTGGTVTVDGAGIGVTGMQFAV